MTTTIVTTTWRQRLTSPVRMAIALTVTAFSVLPAMLARDIRVLSDSTGVFFAAIFAAGAIGQEVGSGVLQLTFARPLVRWRYVIARWLATSSLATGFGLLVMLGGWSAALLRGGDVAAADAARITAEIALAACGVSAVLVCLSSLANGLGDLGLLVVLTFAASVIQGIATYARADWLARAAAELAATLVPKLPLEPYLAGDWSAWPALAAYLSSVTLALALAILFTNRRELSYAAG